MASRQTREALILAAGRGERMKDQGPTKPLVSFLGMSLLERTLRTLVRAGITRAVVVAGHEARTVRREAERFAAKIELELQVVEAEDWHRGNGASALAARDVMGERFLMVMCDHLFEPEMLRRLASHRPPENGVLLAIDRRRDNPLVDHEDVTRVCIRNGHITAIGKGLSPFDAYDTGAFHCTRGLFDALARADGTVSDAIQCLASEGRARIWNIGNDFWADLDDVAAMRRARTAMLRQAAGKAHDGPVARWLNRPISRWLSWHAIHYGLTPMQLSWTAFVLSLLAASLIALPFAWSIAVGGLLAQLTSIADGCDGEVARLTMRESEHGGWLDAVLDRYADALLLSAFMVHAFLHESQTLLVAAAGMAALSGTLINSYTADKYDGWMRRQGKMQRFRLGRDVRLLAMAAMAVLDAPIALLWGIAVVMHMENIRRIVLIVR